jgi:serine phosphatase RsbU (regulator of sigma subunit)
MSSIKTLYYKWRPKLIVWFSLILIGIALLNIYYVLNINVTSNDECLWIPKKVSKDSTAIFFDVVKVEGVTWNAGIRNGDQLIAIDGKVLESTYQAQNILNEFIGGEYADYKYKRNGEVFTTKVYVKKLIQFGNLASTLSSLFWMLIGFIVLTAKPDGKVHRIFYFLGLLAVLSSLNALFPLHGDIGKFYNDLGLLAILIGIIWIVALCFIPFVINYFFWNFPNPFKFAQKKLVRRMLFILPSAISLGLIIIAVLSFTKEIKENSIWQILPFIGYFHIGANITALIALIIQYRRLSNKEQKKPIFLILVASIFALAISLYTAQIAPALADTIFNSPEYYMPIVLVALVPLVFAYSIFKYQLMDVSVVVKNTIIYGAATLSVAVIYFFVIYVAGQSISTALGVENQGIVAGVFFIIFALIFQSTKNKFQDFLTKRFYPEQFAYQRVLIKFNNDVSTVVGLDNILDLMQNTFVEALNIKKFGILIRSDGSSELKLVRETGLSDEECVITQSNLGHFIKEKNLISQLPVLDQNDFERVLPEKAEKLIHEEIFTILPMVVKSRVIGLILFGLKHSGSQFAGKDLELLWAAANQSAVSIENARLYKSEVEKQKIERDLDLARKIQQGLLPQCIPNINGLDICGEMIPAMQVGGDYFDLITLSDRKLFVVVGDVSGKGLSASLYMTKLQTMIQLSCFDDKSPKEVLIDINRRMYQELDKSWFITMTLALFDLETNTLKFCRAGHMPVLVTSNGTVQQYRTQGIGVGLEKGIVFENSLVEEEINLKHGQIFAFFTDGVTEAMNENSELFGEENLNAILSNKSVVRSADIVNEVWSSIKTFRGSAEVNDDMTMVIVKIK